MITLASGTAATSGPGSSVDVDARAAALEGGFDPGGFGEGFAGPGGANLVNGEATTDAGAIVALKPRGRTQRVGMRLYLGRTGSPGSRAGGQRIDRWTTGGWSVNRSLGQPIQTGKFQVGLARGRNPLGSAIATPAPLPGLTAVDLGLAFRYGDDGKIELPLIVNGIADSGDRTDQGTVSDSVDIRDVLARYKDQRITLQLPAGHGFTYSMVCRKVAQLYGIPFSIPDFPSDFAFRKEINISNGDGWAIVFEIGDLFGAQFLVDEAGVLTYRLNAPETQIGPIQGVLDERDILRSVNGSVEPVRIMALPIAWTRACLQGTKQKTKEGGTRYSLPLPSVSRGLYAPAVAPYLQITSGGTWGLAAGSPIDTGDGLPYEVVRSESLTTLDIDGETVAGIDVQTRGWVNVPVARKKYIDSFDGLVWSNFVWLTENSETALAYATPAERFTDLSSSHRGKEFDDQGRIQRESYEARQLHNPEAATRTRDASTDPWETDSRSINGRWLLGNDQGVLYDRAVVEVTQRQTIDYGVTEDGYQISKRTTDYGWKKDPGWQYLYANGETSSSEAEYFGVVADVREQWIPVTGREDLHVYIMEKYDQNGVLIDGVGEVRQGSIQAAEKREDIAPSRDDYDTDAEFDLAVAASRVDMQSMHVHVNLDALLAFRLPRESEPLTYEFAQELWQLLKIGQRFLLKGEARMVEFSIPPNPLVTPGSWWRARWRRPGIDLDHDIIVSDSPIEQRGDGGPIIQRVSGIVYEA